MATFRFTVYSTKMKSQFRAHPISKLFQKCHILLRTSTTSTKNVKITCLCTKQFRDFGSKFSVIPLYIYQFFLYKQIPITCELLTSSGSEYCTKRILLLNFRCCVAKISREKDVMIPIFRRKSQNFSKTTDHDGYFEHSVRRRLKLFPAC